MWDLVSSLGNQINEVSSIELEQIANDISIYIYHYLSVISIIAWRYISLYIYLAVKMLWRKMTSSPGRVTSDLDIVWVVRGWESPVSQRFQVESRLGGIQVMMSASVESKVRLHIVCPNPHTKRRGFVQTAHWSYIFEREELGVRRRPLANM